MWVKHNSNLSAHGRCGQIMSESTNNFSIISVWGSDLAPDDSIFGSGTAVVGSVDVSTSFSTIPLGSGFIVNAFDVYKSLSMFLTSLISSVTSKYAFNPKSDWSTRFQVFGLASGGSSVECSVSSHLMFILNLFDYNHY